MRRLPVLVTVALVAAACSTSLGRATPECTEEPIGSIVMMVQAVQGTSHVPCIDSLNTGWEVNHAVFRSGRASFTVDSDRMGNPFLEVELTEACDPGDARGTTSDEAPIPRLVDVEADFEIRIVVVPEGSSLESRTGAATVAGALHERRVHDRDIVLEIDGSGRPTAERIGRARSSGAHVLVVSVRDAEEGTVTLIEAGEDSEATGLTIDSAFEEIADEVEPPTYRGHWYYPFDGGCVTYSFTAEGPGIRTIESDVQQAFDLMAAEPLRQLARDAGFEIP